MSFKRDETDPGPLGALQKRRVADLLASAIPEDEALLLRSGRFACSVCPHRPVCDTLEALAVHRAGRKHLHSLQRSYGRHRSLQAAAQGPREAPDMAPDVQGCSQAPLLARTRWIAQNALLKSTPYSSCSWRAGTKGSSFWAGIPRMILSPARALPEPSQNPGNPAGSSPAPLPGQTGTPRVARKGKSQNPKESSPERLQILRHHLHLRSRGWIQDPSGKWMKDKNVEFDSDEEEPPALLPG